MDDVRADGRHRGWADRVADALAEEALRAGEDGIAYANLAVRGRLVEQVMVEQVPVAVDLRPDLTSIAVGVNDTLRPTFDLDAVATALENGVRALRGTGSDVLLFAFGNPVRRSRLMTTVRDRIHAYNSAVEAIARHHGCHLVSFWDVAVYDDPRLWADDWLHLSPLGHAITAECVLSTLGLGGDGWRTPLEPEARPPLAARVAGDARWVTGHLVPWVLRRLRGESSGDAVHPKDPAWVRVPPVAAP